MEVDPKVKDYWGIPVARLSGQSIRTRWRLRFIAGKAEAWLKEAGAIRTWKSCPGAITSGGQHQAGTCRMGDDPQTSVVTQLPGTRHGQPVRDRRQRACDQRGFNPALTIMATAYHAADRIVKGQKGRGV